MTLQLKAQLRQTKTRGDLNQMRQSELVPVVVYGHGFKNIDAQVKLIQLQKIWNQAGESSIVELAIDGDKEAHNVLFKEIQKDPVSGRLIHADFLQVRMDEEVTAEVKLNFINEAPAVKELGGNLVDNRDHVLIRCLPKDLISSFDVDLSGLTEFGKAVHVAELALPKTVKLMDDPKLIVVNVVAPVVEKVEEPVAAAVEGEAAPAEAKAEGETAEPGQPAA